MARVKRGVQARRRHKKILKQAKGYYGARSRVFRVAVQAVTKAGQYAYRDRKVSASVSSVVCGSCGSTPPPASTACPTAV